MRRCILLAGGPTSDCAGVSLDRRADDVVIACDAGYRLAEMLGLAVDLAVGDFDSLGEPPALAGKVLQVPSKKNDTDLMLGARQGIAYGCGAFLLIGALGGRLDHTIGNLQVLCWLSRQGYDTQIQSDHATVWAVTDGTVSVALQEGCYLSIFAWGGDCRGVTLEGLAYPLADAVVTPDYPIGISNEFTAQTAHITVLSGTLLVMSCKKDTPLSENV